MPELMVTIQAHHPSLSGHFPGHPVVPAVVILGEIMEAVRHTNARSIFFSAIPNAKFLSPLAPGEELLIVLQQDAEDSVTFTCRVGSRLVAKGSLRYTIAASIYGAENSS
jgi:3-hydroxymyristoyl/3-hydroxydecanoyl-(acyl carrier protein) dehydratase